MLYRGATTSCSACPSAYWFASRLRGCLRIRVRHRAPAAVQARRQAGVFVGHAGRPPSSDLAHGQEQDLPGSLAPHPVTLRRSTTPDDPSRLAARGAAGAAPRLTTLKASSLQLSRLTATLRHPLSTLHDARCRTPCKTRFRPAGCAFAGRESNPLGSVGRVQIISSSFPGLRLALGQFSTLNNTYRQEWEWSQPVRPRRELAWRAETPHINRRGSSEPVGTRPYRRRLIVSDRSCAPSCTGPNPMMDRRAELKDRPPSATPWPPRRLPVPKHRPRWPCRRVRPPRRNLRRLGSAPMPLAHRCMSPP